MMDTRNANLLGVLNFKRADVVRAAIAQKPLLLYLQETQLPDIKKFSFDDFILDDASTAELTCRLETVLSKHEVDDSDVATTSKTPEEVPPSAKVQAVDTKQNPENTDLLEVVVLREPRENAGKVIIDGLEFSASGFGIISDGNLVNLTYRELELFSLFVNNPDFVFTRNQILTILWEHNDSTSRLVDVHIRRIRSKIGINHARHLSTVRGHGYSWQQSVQ
jgi:DNA-binding response OmpR family regulator